MFTQALDYALRGLVHLAALPPGAVCEVKTMAAAYRIPPAYLAKILAALAHAHIVRPQYGSGGGYALALALDQITLRALIESLNGPITLGLDGYHCEACALGETCPAGRNLSRVRQRILAILESITVQDVLTPYGADSTGT